jgi:hypothetical protein
MGIRNHGNIIRSATLPRFSQATSYVREYLDRLDSCRLWAGQTRLRGRVWVVDTVIFITSCLRNSSGSLFGGDVDIELELRY